MAWEQPDTGQLLAVGPQRLASSRVPRLYASLAGNEGACGGASLLLHAADCISKPFSLCRFYETGSTGRMVISCMAGSATASAQLGPGPSPTHRKHLECDYVSGEVDIS